MIADALHVIAQEAPPQVRKKAERDAIIVCKAVLRTLLGRRHVRDMVEPTALDDVVALQPSADRTSEQHEGVARSFVLTTAGEVTFAAAIW